VRVNGQVAVLGSKADPQRDSITIDNQPIGKEQPPIYIAVNKPTGILSEVSPDEPREDVRDLSPLSGHMFIVGRLDKDSEGLILLTNDGEMANRLSHPRYGHKKEYRVLVGVRPDEQQIEAWRHGVVLEDGYRTAPAEVRLEEVAGKGAWLRVILREGRKRQIREMGRQTGVPVLRIQRIRIGSLLLGDLKPGQWRELRPDEIRALKSNLPDRREAPRSERSFHASRRPVTRREGSSHPASGRPEGRPGAGHPRTRRPEHTERRDEKRAPLRTPRGSRSRS
jgi:23S rRNA pseudouridine2605 synthase